MRASCLNSARVPTACPPKVRARSATSSMNSSIASYWASKNLCRSLNWVAHDVPVIVTGLRVEQILVGQEPGEDPHHSLAVRSDKPMLTATARPPSPNRAERRRSDSHAIPVRLTGFDGPGHPIDSGRRMPASRYHKMVPLRAERHERPGARRQDPRRRPPRGCRPAGRRILALSRYLDSDAFRRAAIAAAQEALGSPVTVAQFDVSLFSRAILRKVAIGNPPGMPGSSCAPRRWWYARGFCRS